MRIKNFCGIFIVLAFCILSHSAFSQETSGGFLDGSIRIGYDNRACDGSLAGSIRYNSATFCAEYCNETSWTCPAAAAIPCPSASAGIDVTGGLIHRWTFDEGTGTTAANSVGAQNGTLTGGATWAADGVYGAAVQLDGTNGYVSLGTMDISGAATSIFLWYKADLLTTLDERLISKANGSAEASHWWMLSPINGVQPRARFKAGGSTITLISNSATDFVMTHQWQHIGMTYDGTTLRLYLDGTEVNAAVKSGALNTDNTVAAVLGRNGSVSSNYFKGQIDDVRIFSRALTSAEVLDLYDHGNTALCTN